MPVTMTGATVLAETAATPLTTPVQDRRPAVFTSARAGKGAFSVVRMAAELAAMVVTVKDTDTLVVSRRRPEAGAAVLTTDVMVTAAFVALAIMRVNCVACAVPNVMFV